MGVNRGGCLNKAVFFDRDGVINKSIVIGGRPFPPESLAKMELVEGIKSFLIATRNAGFLNIVITNQPDVARGKTSKLVVEEINNFLIHNLAIDSIKTCYHDNLDFCGCRKPAIGSFIKSKLEYDIDLSQSYMIGDRSSDIEAGKKAGCKTIYVDYNYSEKILIAPDYRVDSIAEGLKIFLECNEKY
jgi:D-glycero-D-manno-heptose 1,7-bisphosphate phosphatase